MKLVLVPLLGKLHALHPSLRLRLVRGEACVSWSKAALREALRLDLSTSSSRSPVARCGMCPRVRVLWKLLLERVGRLRWAAPRGSARADTPMRNATSTRSKSIEQHRCSGSASNWHWAKKSDAEVRLPG